MTGLGWWCIEVASSVLAPREREAVLGDLAEAGGSVWQGISDIADLAMRRQAQPWTSWRPWLVGFGLAWPGSLFLIGFSLSVSHGIERLVGAAFTHATLNADSYATPIFHALLLIISAWTCGFVIASVSRRTLWASILMCCLPCTYCMAEFPTGLLASSSLLVFLLPAIWGTRQGLRGVQISPAVAIALATAATDLSVSTWLRGGWWPYSLALIWPGWYLVATAKREAMQGRLERETIV
jgi:hypothetical protein